jgi:putative CocE/NonD family hydrolase
VNFIAPILAALAIPAAGGGGLHVKVPMRDGVKLCANIFVPKGSGRFPTILIRTPYNKGSSAGGYQTFVDHGFAVMVQDVRGKHHSEGVFDPLFQEGPDGSDTLDWIARQPWSNGEVGMLGGSYLGIAQWRVAVLNNPHLKAIFPAVSGCDEYRDRFYSSGGAFKLGHRLQWMAENMRAPDHRMPAFWEMVQHLPLRTADRVATGLRVEMFQRVMDHPAHDAFWDAISVLDRIHEVRIPVFSVGGWYDNYVQSDLEAFSRLRPKTMASWIVVGPWTHNISAPVKTVDFGPHALIPLRSYQLEWFEHWLKTAPVQRARRPFPHPPARIFVMGENRWREEKEWPLARTREVRYFLTSRRGANSLEGDGELTRHAARHVSADRYIYDPRDPAPTMGGAVCCNERVFPWGPMDQRPVEKRRDVLVYTSRPLRTDLEVTGTVTVRLYVSTSAPDTDFTAKLVDVYPDGRAINLTDGILRLRYRESLEKPVTSKPGEVYAIKIDAGVTSNVFKAGHRIRLEISSSNFPRFDRNLNTGRAQADETEMRPANQTVWHGGARASYLALPVIPRGGRR